MKTAEKNQIEFTRVNSDINGNSRHVIHFLSLVNEGDKIKADTAGIASISNQYNLALIKAKQLGGRKYHNRSYGGGIVFQMFGGSYSEMSKTIKELNKVNTKFLKEWTPAQFAKVNKAILKHFKKYTYKHLATHGGQLINFRPFNFKEIDNLLGLAYTSTGSYAGLWVCSGGYLMANDTHHFTGFMINELGEVVASVEDENENTIFITL